jgi:hypothetical protein
MEEEVACASVAEEDELGGDGAVITEEQVDESEEVIQTSPWMDTAIAMKDFTVVLYEESAGPSSTD